MVIGVADLDLLPDGERVEHRPPALLATAQLLVGQQACVELGADLVLVEVGPDEDDLLTAVAVGLLPEWVDCRGADRRVIGPLVEWDRRPPRTRRLQGQDAAGLRPLPGQGRARRQPEEALGAQQPLKRRVGAVPEPLGVKCLRAR